MAAHSPQPVAAQEPASGPKPAATAALTNTFGWHNGWRYGLMGLPLAFVALPLYVLLPNHYALHYGVPLATLGALLLGARLLDAVIDPLLGRWCDRLYARSTRSVLAWAAAAALALGLGFSLLFFPPVQIGTGLLVWAAACLLLTYAAYSLLSILHQSWGALLGGDEVQRSRIFAWREGLGLLGVLLASVAPSLLGLGGTSALLFVALGLGWWAWGRAVRPVIGAQQLGTAAAHAPAATPSHGGKPAVDRSSAALWQPFANPAFRALLAVLMVNGIASAVPATLILFFVQDRLQAPAATQPLFLGSYFLSAALAIPLWLKLVGRIGLARTWGLGMLLAIAVFVFASQLGSGDTAAFLLVCALSGVALATDLALPSALLAGAIAAHGERGQAEGAYFGWWNFATKLNLALAAGLALPALGWLGYAPGAQDAAALQTLTFAYCLLPCALKLLAATLLYTLIIRRNP
ncbi:MAG: MFS transporter [Rhodoferax sp.]|nr:MFS transporter [Rhodoferax sp.]